jgi:hypothetical protein
MKTQVTITIEHPDNAPIYWFMSYTLEQYIREINADMQDGWAIRLGVEND